MQLYRRTVEGIVDGTIDLVFRRQRRATVRAGGTRLTQLGLLAIDAVDVIDEKDITDADARRAGFGSAADVIASLRPEGQLYRVQLHYAGEDPRIALRNDAALSDEDVAAIQARLDRLDRASSHGPWTDATLRLIAENPETRAAELAESQGREMLPFKIDVRKLKALGLTESLRPGYRLSPRGEEFLRRR